ncbi:MAG: translation initiation factor 2 [Clostridia bacterium]|nr:translation initiation factor 2 [Clostridia bacterium]
MVKGVNRRVIVVKSPDPKLFEQAIFIMREDAFLEGVTADQVVKEAQQVAKGYVKRNSRLGKWMRSIPGPAYVALGAVAASFVWSIAMFF